MSDIQYFLTDCGVEVNVDPIFHKKFNDCYGAEFKVNELIFMLSKLGIDVKKLQAEGAELEKLQEQFELLKNLLDINTSKDITWATRDELKELEALREENAMLKKQSKRNDLKENWPPFLAWYGDYCDLGGSSFTWPAIQHSREDMRYAYQAGYEAALPTAPEGGVIC